jgi:hypothetical protein
MLQPLPYHLAIRDYLKQCDPRVWNWFALHHEKSEAHEELKFELLKSTYRLSPESHSQIYSIAADAARSLAIDVPITIYQAQSAAGLNASLAYCPQEVHIVLHGDLVGILNETELKSIIAHELGHFSLFHLDGGSHLRAWDMLTAICNDRSPHPAHQISLRWLQLYSELYCDRASLHFVGDLNSVVAALLKVSTNATKIEPTDFLKQADEIYARENASARESTHPELFIRARALRLHSESAPKLESQITAMIEGAPELAGVDLVEQQKISGDTRKFILLAMSHPTMRSELNLAHAKLFFPDFSMKEFQRWSPADVPRLSERVNRSASIVDYFSYILLDFATSDRSLDDFPLAHCLHVAQLMKIKERFVELARKELKVRKGDIEKIDRNKEDLLRVAREQQKVSS